LRKLLRYFAVSGSSSGICGGSAGLSKNAAC
jgi:hypothetical protein